MRRRGRAERASGVVGRRGSPGRARVDGVRGGRSRRNGPGRVAVWAILGAASFAAPLAAQQPEVFVGRTAELYVNATVIDGRGGPARPETAILVIDGRIEGIGSREQLVLPPGTSVVDVEGAVVVPGYLDAWGGRREGAALAELAAAGITGVREAVTSLDDFRRRGRSVDADDPAPIVFVGGVVLDSGANAIGLALSSQDDVPAAMGRLVEVDGAAFVSIARSVPAEWIPAIAREARRRDATVWVNPRTRGWLLALRAGVDVSSGLISGDPEMLTGDARAGYAELLDDSDAAPLAAWLAALDPSGDEVERAITALLSRDAAVVPLLAGAAATPGIEVVWPTAETLVRRLHAEGVRLLVGSGPDGEAGRFHDELERLVAAGVPAVEVIAMATRNVAGALGVLHDRGTLETGKRADFVVLEGDPTDDMANARRVDFLVVEGEAWRPRPEGGFERLRFR